MSSHSGEAKASVLPLLYSSQGTFPDLGWALPFELATAPWVFTKIIVVVVAHQVRSASPPVIGRLANPREVPQGNPVLDRRWCAISRSSFG